MADQSPHDPPGIGADRHRSTWWRVLATAPFRRLLSVRLVGQVADGLLQIGVAGFVFFSPERAAEPARVAAGLAILLLPYSLIGPFVGVLLDRWSRRQVLVVANVVRAAGLLVLAVLVGVGSEGPGFYLLALVVLGVNRFVLAALGAALPHVVEADVLVTANAIAPSAGTVATTIGAGLGVWVRACWGGGDPGSAAAVGSAAVACLVAGTLALRLGRTQLGPDRKVRVALRRAVRDVVVGVWGGLRHLAARPAAARSLAVLTGYRFCYGVAAVWAILLFRNTFHPEDPDLAFRELGLTVLAVGAGVLLGALTTPRGTAWVGTARWSSTALVVAGVTQLAIGVSPRVWSLLVGTAVIAAAAQAVKIGVDSVVQTTIDDEFRGRVFTVYDLLFNASFVAAAASAAVLLPASGESVLVVGLMSAGYLALAVWFGRTSLPGPQP